MNNKDPANTDEVSAMCVVAGAGTYGVSMTVRTDES